jgi:hypothetical protein
MTSKKEKGSISQKGIDLKIEELEQRIAPSGWGSGQDTGYQRNDFPNHGDSAKPPGHWGPGHFPPGNHKH